jgi:ribonuclease E
MLINAQRPEQLRIATVDGSLLENYQVEIAEAGLTRGNIYRGVIANIQPSLNAAFIDYGPQRHGFLAIQDVVDEAFYNSPKSSPPRIEDILERGKPIVVQVQKDAVGQKGAALTTSLSLAGRYCVLTPFDDTRGVSRKVEDEDIRKKLKALAAQLALPPGCGVIMRTNALEQNKTAIARDLAALLRLWKRVQTAALTGTGSRLLYTDQDLIVQALRDQLDTSIEEVVVDDDAAFQKAQAYMDAFMPRAKTQLLRYEERVPLFSRYDLETQIARIYERRVELTSGGSIVIDSTEALTAIDVNSGRSTRAATQEETAVSTNLEAAAEVARQLRLRDLAGLIVVDFIDMRASKNQRRVEKTMREAMKADRARSTIGRISANGLLEINRQRIQQALALRTHRPCPTCAGSGRLASPEMVSLNLLRRIEARAATGTLQGVRIELHPELADAMQNGRRQELAELERKFEVRIEIIAAAGLHRPDEQLEWIRREGATAPLPAPPPRREPVAAPANGAPEGAPATTGAPADRPDGKHQRNRRRGGRRRRREGEQAAPGVRRAEAAPEETPVPPAERGERGKGKRPRRRRRSRGSGTRPETPSERTGEAPRGPAAEPSTTTSPSARSED